MLGEFRCLEPARRRWLYSALQRVGPFSQAARHRVTVPSTLATSAAAPRTLWQGYAIAFLLALGVVVANAFARFAYALVLPAMREDLGWNYVQAGFLNTANGVGYLIGAVLTRLVIVRTGNRVLFIGGVALTALAVLATGFARGIEWLAFWRIACGIFGAAAFVAGGALSGNILPHLPARAPVTIAIYFGGGGVGFLLCGVPLPLLLEAAGAAAWPRTWMWMGAAGLILTLFCAWAALRIEEPGAAPAGGHAPHTLAPLAAGLAAYFMFGLGYIGYMTFVIAWMRDLGQGTVAVIAVWTTFGVASLAGPWVWGRALARWTPGRMLAGAMAMLAAGTLVPLLANSLIALMLSAALFGASMWNVPGSVTALSKRALPMHAWGAAVATFTIVFSVGQIAGPVLAGALADLSGSLKSALLVSAAILATGSVIALAQRDVVHR